MLRLSDASRDKLSMQRTNQKMAQQHFDVLKSFVNKISLLETSAYSLLTSLQAMEKGFVSLFSESSIRAVPVYKQAREINENFVIFVESLKKKVLIAAAQNVPQAIANERKKLEGIVQRLSEFPPTTSRAKREAKGIEKEIVSIIKQVSDYVAQNNIELAKQCLIKLRNDLLHKYEPFFRLSQLPKNEKTSITDESRFSIDRIVALLDFSPSFIELPNELDMVQVSLNEASKKPDSFRPISSASVAKSPQSKAPKESLQKEDLKKPGRSRSQPSFPKMKTSIPRRAAPALPKVMPLTCTAKQHTTTTTSKTSTPPSKIQQHISSSTYEAKTKQQTPLKGQDIKLSQIKTPSPAIKTTIANAQETKAKTPQKLEIQAPKKIQPPKKIPPPIPLIKEITSINSNSPPLKTTNQKSTNSKQNNKPMSPAISHDSKTTKSKTKASSVSNSQKKLKEERMIKHIVENIPLPIKKLNADPSPKVQTPTKAQKQSSQTVTPKLEPTIKEEEKESSSPHKLTFNEKDKRSSTNSIIPLAQSTSTLPKYQELHSQISRETSPTLKNLQKELFNIENSDTDNSIPEKHVFITQDCLDSLRRIEPKLCKYLAVCSSEELINQFSMQLKHIRKEIPKGKDVHDDMIQLNFLISQLEENFNSFVPLDSKIAEAAQSVADLNQFLNFGEFETATSIERVGRRLFKLGGESALAAAGPIGSIDISDHYQTLKESYDEMLVEFDQEKQKRILIADKTQSRSKYLRRLDNNHKKVVSYLPKKGCDEFIAILQRQADIISKLEELN